MSGSFGDGCGALPDVMVAGSGPNSAIHSTSGLINSRSGSGYDSDPSCNAGASAAHNSVANPAHRKHLRARRQVRPAISAS